jgi:hypothetical protein
MITPDEMRAAFLSTFIRGDFFNTQIHFSATLIRLVVEQDDASVMQRNTELRQFSQLYGDNGEKKYMVGMFIQTLKRTHKPEDVPTITTLR